MFPLRLLPEAYRESWCVAGGWAACPPLASDMDVWVYGVPTDDIDTVRQELLDWLTGLRPRVWFTVADESRSAEGYMHPCVVRKVAVITPSYTAKPIHLMVTDACAPGEILAGFDISSHAVAINYDGSVIQWHTYTPPSVPPVKLLDTDTTPARMAKIAIRFGHPVPTEAAHVAV